MLSGGIINPIDFCLLAGNLIYSCSAISCLAWMVSSGRLGWHSQGHFKLVSLARFSLTLVTDSWSHFGIFYSYCTIHSTDITLHLSKVKNEESMYHSTKENKWKESIWWLSSRFHARIIRSCSFATIVLLWIRPTLYCSQSMHMSASQ